MPSIFMMSQADDGLPGLYPLTTDDALIKSGSKFVPTAGKLIPISSFSHALDLPVANLRPSFSASRFRVGVVDQQPIVIQRTWDQCSGSLMQQFLKRQVIPSLQIIIGIAAPKDDKTNEMTPYWLLRLSDALFTHYEYASTADGTVAESIRIAYAAISWGVRWPKDDDNKSYHNIVWSTCKPTNEITKDEMAPTKPFKVVDPLDVFDPKKW